MKLKTLGLKIIGKIRKIFRKKSSKKPPKRAGLRAPKQRKLPSPEIIKGQIEGAVELSPGFDGAGPGGPLIPRDRIFAPAPSTLAATREFASVQLSPHTQRAYERDLNDFFIYLKSRNSIGSQWGGDLSPLHVAQYREYLVRDKKLAKSSATRKLAVLKSFFKWAQSRQWISYNPAELVRGFPQTQDSKTGYLNSSELDLVFSRLNSTPTDRLADLLNKVSVETLLMLGLRRSEACALCWGHIEYNDDQWLVRVQGKGDRERLLPIAPKLLRSWAQWARRVHVHAPQVDFAEQPKAWLDFVMRHRDLPILISTRSKVFTKSLSTSELAMIVRKVCRRAGVLAKVSPHMLRATAITHALDEGASHRGVQQMAGWTSPLMITRYDKRRKDPKLSAVHNLKYARD